MATFSHVEAAESLWYPNLAANAHITPEEGVLSSKAPYTGSDKVEVGNGSFLHAANIGLLTLKTHPKPLSLNYALHVPQLKHNLLSIRGLCRDNDCHVKCNGSCFSVKENTTGKVLLQAPSTGNLYLVSLIPTHG